MRKIIVANWKMNPENAKRAKELFTKVKKALLRIKLRKGKGIKNIRNVEVVICPPFVYIPILAPLSSKALSVGGQNVFYKEKGAFTGEVSPMQLKSLKIRYVILGHSESRKYLNETDEIVNKKIKEVLAVKLKPILCVGENKGEDKLKVLKKQITGGLMDVSAKEAGNIVIAYEPVWAIGTGYNCSVKETLSSVLFIRKVIERLYSKEISEAIRILYGGSVNYKNSALYIKKGGVSGLLVGKDSLNAKDFIKMVSNIN